MKSLSVLCFCVLLGLQANLLAAKPGESGWPQWRGPNRDGISSSTGLLKDWETTKPKKLWEIDGLGAGYASVSIADSMLYSTGNFDDSGQGVVAVDLESKKVAWKTILTKTIPEHGYKGSRCTPTIDGDYLYVVISDGTVACLARKTGKLIWERHFKDDWNGKKPQWGFAESPLIDGDKLICTPGSKNALLVALNKMTGEEIWATKVTEDLGERGKPEAGYSSVVISEGTGLKHYVQLVGKGVVGVHPDSGQLLWHYNYVANGVANIPTCIAEGNYVFASTGYGTGACLLELKRTAAGIAAEEVYFLEQNVFQNHHGGMIKLGDFIYSGNKHGKGFPICIEMKSGEIKWSVKEQKELVGKGSAAITLADGNLIFRYESGEIALIEATPKEYRLKGSFKPDYQKGKSWAHPVVLDGLLYLREQDKLMVYDLKS